LKETYATSTELAILCGGESGKENKKPNCRVQVLPVQWRQEIQFGVSKDYNDNTEKKMSERDIGEASDEEMAPEDPGNATLQDITAEGLAPIRSLISDGTSTVFFI
jgi:hypothetical protein